MYRTQYAELYEHFISVSTVIKSSACCDAESDHKEASDTPFDGGKVVT